jgi:type IV pilus assembly protein PilM
MGLPLLNGSSKRRDHIVAVDLGGRTTKAVYVQRRGERFSLTNYVILDAPAADKTVTVDTLTEHLQQVARALGAGRSRPTTVALGVNDCIFRQVEVPLMTLTDLRQMLKYNTKTYLQQDLAGYVFDCHFSAPRPAAKPAEGEGKKPTAAKQKVMVGGAREQTISDLQKAIKDAGLVPDQVVPGVVGPTNAFEMAETETFRKEVVALVDLGFKHSTITILDNGEIILNRVVAIGGDRLTSGLAESMNISYVEAENIKVGMPGEVQSNLESVLNPLGRELRASIDFFENQQDRTVAQVFVSGGSARSEFIIHALQTELLVPCKSWNPARFLQLALSPEKMGELEQVAPQLVVAIGAAASAF